MNLSDFKAEILRILQESGRFFEIKDDGSYIIAVFTESGKSFVMKLQNGPSVKKPKSKKKYLKEFKDKYVQGSGKNE